MSVRREVEAALAAVGVTQADRGTAELALTYAREIDGGAPLEKLGPPLLAALEALGLTPRARKAVKDDVQRPGGNPLDQLAARRAGKSRTETSHAATS